MINDHVVDVMVLIWQLITTDDIVKMHLAGSRTVAPNGRSRYSLLHCMWANIEKADQVTARLKLAHRAGLLPPPYHLNFPPVPSLLHNVHIPLNSHHFIWETTNLDLMAPRCCLFEINSSTKLGLQLHREIYFNTQCLGRCSKSDLLVIQVLLLWERLFQSHSAVFVFYQQSKSINLKGLTQFRNIPSETRANCYRKVCEQILIHHQHQCISRIAASAGLAHQQDRRISRISVHHQRFNQ